MKLLVYDNFMGVVIETWVHSSREALVQWSRKHRRLDYRPYGLAGFCSHFVKPNAVEVHIAPYEPGNMTVLHEFQHAVDFVSSHTPNTHDRKEVRAYLLCGLMQMYKSWHAADYDLQASDFKEAERYIAMARRTLKRS